MQQSRSTSGRTAHLECKGKQHLMKESVNCGLNLGKEGAKNLFLGRVFGS